MKDVSKQKNRMNCGVYTLWYLLVQCCKGKKIVDLDSDRFCDQCLLYITFLYVYQTLVKTPNYIFPQSFEWCEVILRRVSDNKQMKDTISFIFEIQIEEKILTKNYYKFGEKNFLTLISNQIIIVSLENLILSCPINFQKYYKICLEYLIAMFLFIFTGI